MKSDALVVTFKNLPDVRLANIAREFDRVLSQAGASVEHADASLSVGERGDPISIGVVILALITSGAVTSAIDCFKAYLSREESLVIKLTQADGTQFEVNSLNVDTEAVGKILKASSSKS